MSNEHEEFRELLISGPFGNPDAAFANVQHPVYMDDAFPNLGVSPGRLSTHLIVGRKGAGKTFHWKILQVAAHERPEIIAILDDSLLHEATVKEISSRAIKTSPANFWSLVWRRAIFCFLASLFYKRHSILNSEYGSRLIPKIHEELFSERFESIFPIPFVETKPIQYVEKFASKGGRRDVIGDFIFNEAWVELESVIKNSLPETSPIYVFIDAIDQQAASVPQMWHDCQSGLFLAILQLIRETKGRFHVVATIRESVYRAHIATEHGTKIIDDSHIRLLDWGRRENEFFAKEKIANARGKSGHEETLFNVISEWLGFSEIKNIRRGIAEKVDDYIIRHTRYLPRDIVIIGNAIHKDMESCRKLGEKFTEGRLRRVIERCSKLFAHESIESSLNEMLVTQHTVNEYARMLDVDSSAIEYMKDNLRIQISEFISGIGKQVFSEKEMLESMSKINISVDSSESSINRYRIENVFWRNGLIAYLDDRNSHKKWIYNWHTIAESEHLISGAPKYGFHPSIADRYGLRLEGEELVS